jgi:DUF4097 and DUF4098 domain-containing protein YvlB
MSTRNAWLAAAILAAAVPPAIAEQRINKRVNVTPDVTVEVSNVQGSVTITAWDRNEVELVAELESQMDELEFEATERHVRIEVDRPSSRHGRGDEEDAHLTLRVPSRARLIVDTVSAEIGVTGARGEQRLESVSGEVRTQAFDAAVRATSVSGDVTVTGNGGKAGVTTENVSGTSTVTGVRGNYHGEVVSGEINAVVTAGESLELSSVSGDINLQADLTSSARVEMGSVSGTVTVKLKPPVNADFNIESFSGDIDNCFGPKSRDTSKYAPGSELNFTQGSGGARVEIETLSGEISLCDR